MMDELDKQFLAFGLSVALVAVSAVFLMSYVIKQDLVTMAESCEAIGGDLVFTHILGSVCVTENAKYVRSEMSGNKWVRWTAPTGGRD